MICDGLTYFIIHPYAPTVVIGYLIWPCDKAVRITYLISHSSVFLAGTLKALVLRTHASRTLAVKPHDVKADFINTLGWFCI